MASSETAIIKGVEEPRLIHLTEEDLLNGKAKLKAAEGLKQVSDFYSETGIKLDAGRTVRSGYAYDFDSTEEVLPQDAERAANIKAELGDEPLVGIEERYLYRFVKRTFDIAFSAAVIVFFSWLYIIVAIAVKVDDPKGPVFFKQERVGWSIIGQKSGVVSANAPRPALSALEARGMRHSRHGLGVAA